MSYIIVDNAPQKGMNHERIDPVIESSIKWVYNIQVQKDTLRYWRPRHPNQNQEWRINRRNRNTFDFFLFPHSFLKINSSLDSNYPQFMRPRRQLDYTKPKWRTILILILHSIQTQKLKQLSHEAKSLKQLVGKFAVQCIITEPEVVKLSHWNEYNFWKSRNLSGWHVNKR